MAQVSFEVKRLHLRHNWTTTMSSSAYRETVHLRYTNLGITGLGEGAPIHRYNESAASTLAALEQVRPVLEAADPWQHTPLLDHLRKLLPNQRAALAAIDLALNDWLGRSLNVATYKLFGLDPENIPHTSFSIGIDTPAITRQKTRDAAAYQVLKIKVGLDTDEETIAAVRSMTDKPLRVDANEGWTDPEEAIRKINWLETQGVELIEQPMPAHMSAEIRYVRGKVHLPLFADEACTSAQSIPGLRESYDGINVKIDKAGGLFEAQRWIAIARACHLRVMLGCMISSSLSTTAAAHLAPLADLVDLDGALLLADDPYEGMQVSEGRIRLPTAPGLGVTARSFMWSP